MKRADYLNPKEIQVIRQALSIAIKEGSLFTDAEVESIRRKLNAILSGQPIPKKPE